MAFMTQICIQLSVMETRCRAAVSEKEQLGFKLTEMEKEKKAIEKKLTQQQSKVTKLSADLKEEKEVLDWELVRGSEIVVAIQMLLFCADEQVPV